MIRIPLCVEVTIEEQAEDLAITALTDLLQAHRDIPIETLVEAVLCRVCRWYAHQGISARQVAALSKNFVIAWE